MTLHTNNPKLARELKEAETKTERVEILDKYMHKCADSRVCNESCNQE